MPEGDTIFRAARTLHRALAGRAVTQFESVYPALTRVNHDTPLAGRIVDGVTARGKHLLMQFSGDLLLHTHMRMHGSWHIYKPGERWRAPSSHMRIVVGTSAYVAVAFDVPIAEFLTSDALARHESLQSLGPDLADPAFDRTEVRRRMAEHGSEPLHEVLLNQRVLAGIGNELKSEVLFLAKLHPFARTDTLDDERFARLMDLSVRLMSMNIIESKTLGPVRGRRTTGSLDPRAKVFVYGRVGKPCRTCDAAIRSSKAGLNARLTYWCPRCQPEG
ncbi:MAG: DNA-formamidopyrimidine glycosylase family protein [Vicinamibacterales bacterium]